MSNPTLIELREDTSDSNVQVVANPGEYQVTLNNPLVLRENDELALSSVFVDSVATNSGKIVIDDDETEFEIKNFLYLNNYENDGALYQAFKRPGATAPAPTLGPIVLGLNDGFDYVACRNTGVKDHTTELISQISLELKPFDAKAYTQGPVAIHFAYKSVLDEDMTFVVAITKTIDLKDEINRAGVNPTTGDKNTAFYNMGDYQKDFFELPPGFPFDCKTGTLTLTNMVQPAKKPGFLGFTGKFTFIGTEHTFNAVKLEPFIFTYNFTIPAGAYDPSEFARILTDKMSSQNITSTDNVNFTDVADDNENKYITAPNLFRSPYLNYGSALATLNQDNDDIYGCRFDGEGIILTSNDNILFGSSQVGVEFDPDQEKFLFSQLHSPLYINTANVATMGTKFTSVAAGNGDPTANTFVANKTGGIGFTELKPLNVWFKKLGFSHDVITNFGVRNFDGAGTQKADYVNITGQGVALSGLSPITFTLNDGVNTTGNFTSLDSAINKTTPRVLSTLGTLTDTSQIIKQIYAVTGINEGGSLPYYLIEIDGKGIKSDIRGGVESAIQNTKISAIVSRYYQTLSYTSSMDGSGAIPYIHKGQPLIIDSFKIRILDPDGTLTDNIQDSNVVFLQHTPGQ